MTIRQWGRGPKATDFEELGAKLWLTTKENWHLGFTSFGGPPVHVKIFRDRFVNKLHWIDDQIFQELFSVSQALCGPASTKMLYCINLIHNGFPSAVYAFLTWSLPGAIGMLALAIGVSNIGESLPRAVYALLSGLNAATVGIVALAAVELSAKATTDSLTRALVFLGAAASLMYNALWYFPLLMLLAGIAAVVHDFRWLHGPVKAVAGLCGQIRGNTTRERVSEEGEVSGANETRHAVSAAAAAAAAPAGNGGSRSVAGDQGDNDGRNIELRNRNEDTTTAAPAPAPAASTSQTEDPTNDSAADSHPRVVPSTHRLPMTWKTGLAIILLFLASFVVVMVARGTVPSSRLFALFSNMYLAGTVIFGGGPVVIPLLREYIVAEGWVAPRDFLLGLALIQSFPGPNFNFAVYLGALTAVNAGYHPVAGAVLGWVGIFLPGMWLVHGTMGVWGAVRGWRWVKSCLRGVNAAAVGLIYTAVYRLWEIGYIDEGFETGASLAREPWWVVVTATSYVGGCWFGVSPPVAILLGGVMGMIWYGVKVA